MVEVTWRAVSLPSRERGLKRQRCDGHGIRLESLPSRERGLKPAMAKEIQISRTSLPSRERGLKRGLDRQGGSRARVAPLAGAWIETCESAQ